MSFNLIFYTDDGTYAMKKVLIQNSEQLELVREEIRVSSLFSHPNLLPLLDHAIIGVKVTTMDCSSCLVHILLPFCSLFEKKKYIIAILSICLRC